MLICTSLCEFCSDYIYTIMTIIFSVLLMNNILFLDENFQRYANIK